VIAVDTNVLVHGHREDSPWHAAARGALERVAAGRWAIPWSCVHEFLAIVTHPRVFDPPSPLADAVAAVDGWLASPTLELLHETSDYWEVLAPLLRNATVVGARVHDARIAALCLAHGVDELWTADRDFARFPALRTRNPLVAGKPG
jgi:hypothetical protein